MFNTLNKSNDKDRKYEETKNSNKIKNVTKRNHHYKNITGFSNCI